VGVQQVEIETASLHDALSRFHGDPDVEVLLEDVGSQPLHVDVWLLRFNPILITEAPLLSLRVGQAVEQTLVVSI